MPVSPSVRDTIPSLLLCQWPHMAFKQRVPIDDSKKRLKLFVKWSPHVRQEIAAVLSLCLCADRSGRFHGQTPYRLFPTIYKSFSAFPALKSRNRPLGRRRDLDERSLFSPKTRSSLFMSSIFAKNGHSWTIFEGGIASGLSILAVYMKSTFRKGRSPPTIKSMDMLAGGKSAISRNVLEDYITMPIPGYACFVTSIWKIIGQSIDGRYFPSSSTQTCILRSTPSGEPLPR